MEVKSPQNAVDSSKSEVGEIDTSAPFESVKAAVSLFGVAAPSSGKPMARKPKSLVTEQNMVAKETQLQLAQKELDKLKEQLNNAEAMRARALVDLEEAKKAAKDLTSKLKNVNESKESAVKATTTANNQISECKEVYSRADSEDVADWALELEKSREQFSIIIAQLDGAKQELSRTRRDLEASIDAKSSAFLREAEAKKLTISCRERGIQLAKEVNAVKESLVLAKHALLQVQTEESKIRSEKELSRLDHKLALETTVKTAASLRGELDPEVPVGLKSKLAKVEAEVNSTKKELADLKQADLESSAGMATELDTVRETLRQVAEEEASLRGLAELLSSELEKIRKENSELTEKEAQTESLVADLDRKLREAKKELHVARVQQLKVEASRDGLVSAWKQLLLEVEDAKKEAEEMHKAADELRKEAIAAGAILNEAEKKLHAALGEVEEAKLAAEAARKEIKLHSEKTGAVARTSTSDSGETIAISPEEHQSLVRIVEESEELVEMKVAAAAAQVDAVRTSERETARRLEMLQQELKEVNLATEEALKRAQMAEAARRAVEAELKRWREKEKAAEHTLPAVAVAAPPQLGHLIKGNRSLYHLSGEQQ